MLRFSTLLVCALLSLALFAPMAGAKVGPNVQAKASLERVLPDIKFSGVALRDCFDFLRDVSGANIHVNWKALEAAGVTQETQVNIRLRSVSLSKVLGLLLSETGAQATLTSYLDEGVIEITTKELSDKIMITKVYNVEDLLVEISDYQSNSDFSLASANSGNGNNGGGNNGYNSGGNNTGNNNRRSNSGTSGGGMGGGNRSSMGTGSGTGGGGGATAGKTKDERGQALVDLVIETIQPEIWRKNGGPAAIRFWQGSLIVTAPRSVHEQIGGPVD